MVAPHTGIPLMSERSLPYVIHSDEECERLELQARLANIEGHLRHLPMAGARRGMKRGGTLLAPVSVSA